MYQTRGEYDSGVNTFSPEGRIFQVEYAMEAIKLGSTSIGICTKEGVVLAVDKRLTSPLVISSSVEKILEIDNHIGAAMSGLVADARTLIDKARIEAQQHIFTFNEQIKVRSIAQSICDTSLGFGKGEDMPSRPFGVALLVAGVDEDGPQLYKTDPSGSYKQWDAVAIGSAGPGAQTALDEEYNANLTLQEGLILGLKVLKQVMENFELRQVELATVVPGEGFKILKEEEVSQLITELP